MPSLSRHWIREVDRRAIERYGMTGLVLMENAARGAVEVLQGLSLTGPVAIVCGRGNNAGDGFAIARHLEARGVEVSVLLSSNPTGLRGDAAANFAILQRARTPIIEAAVGSTLQSALQGCEWIVDALLGTGATGDLRSPFAEIVDVLNLHSAKRFAVDLPSGLDCDTGRCSPVTFRADHTATFVAPKPGMLRPEAQRFVGQLHIVDIGVPRKLRDEIFAEAAANPTVDQ
jgi:NAD(P)H-hydrate epimerase